MMRRARHKNPKSRSHPATSDPKMNLPDENGWTPLMKACNRESLDHVRQLIVAGAGVHKGDADGFGPMMCACVEGRADVVRFLLTYSAAVDRADEQGRTPLSWTVTKGDFHETAGALISAGADANRPDKDGFTPLMRAALLSNFRVSSFLFAKART